MRSSRDSPRCSTRSTRPPSPPESSKAVSGRERADRSLFHANSVQASLHRSHFRVSPRWSLGTSVQPRLVRVLRRMPRARSGSALASISRNPTAMPIVPRARSVFSRSTIDSNRRSRDRGNASWHNGWGRTPDSFSIPIFRPRSTFCPSEPSSGFGLPQCRGAGVGLHRALALSRSSTGCDDRRRQGQAGESCRRDLSVALPLMAGNVCGMSNHNVAESSSGRTMMRRHCLPPMSFRTHGFSIQGSRHSWP